MRLRALFENGVPFRASFWSAIQKEPLSEARKGTLSEKYSFPSLVWGLFPKSIPFRGSFGNAIRKESLSEPRFGGSIRKKSLSEARFGVLSEKSPFLSLVLEDYPKRVSS